MTIIRAIIFLITRNLFTHLDTIMAWVKPLKKTIVNMFWPNGGIENCIVNMFWPQTRPQGVILHENLCIRRRKSPRIRKSDRFLSKNI